MPTARKTPSSAETARTPRAAAKAAPRAEGSTRTRPAAKAPVAVKPAPVKAAPAKPAPVEKAPAAKAPAQPAAEPVRAAKLKAKPVRDSFTMPQADFDLIAVLKQRALGFQRPVKKSELLRAGLHVLSVLDDAHLQAALDTLTPLKPGRPKKGG